jgi:transposase
MSPATVTTQPIWVAIDIAKDRHVALLELASGSRRTIRIANRRHEIDQFVTLLHQQQGSVRIALEPTGNYHRTLAYRLITEGFDVRLISSVACARYRDAQFNSWDKNDPKDAAVLLALLKQGLTQRYVDPVVSEFHGIQELSRTYTQIARDRTRLQHSLLTHYLPLYFPEMSAYWSTTRTEWFIRFLHRFPVPTAITALSEETFVAEASPLVGRKVRKDELLRGLYAVAHASVALPIPEHSVAIETFRLQLQRYAQLEAQRTQLEQQSEDVLHQNPAYVILRSIPGIGPVLALTILAEAGDLRRFSHVRQFLKYCGLDLATYQSGTLRGQTCLSKRGNALLRRACWLAAGVAVRMRENSFRTKYERYLGSDPTNPDRKRKALTAVTAKMARVIYTLVTTQHPYRAYHERDLPHRLLPRGRSPHSKAVDTPVVRAMS